jgi:hypothetical protein
MHQVRLNKETLSFYDALMAESVRANQGWSDIWYYAESSLYTQRIVDYLSTFGKKNVKIILAEELFSKTNIVMKDLFRYLGIDPQFNLDVSKVYNRSGQPKSKLLASLISQPNRLKTLLKKIIPADTRLKILLTIQDLNTGEKPKIDQRSLRYLQSYFRNDISEIENIIGRPTDWRISG